MDNQKLTNLEKRVVDLEQVLAALLHLDGSHYVIDLRGGPLTQEAANRISSRAPEKPAGRGN